LLLLLSSCWWWSPHVALLAAACPVVLLALLLLLLRWSWLWPWHVPLLLLHSPPGLQPSWLAWLSFRRWLSPPWLQRGIAESTLLLLAPAQTPAAGLTAVRRVEQAPSGRRCWCLCVLVLR
jgi:hypothetical protein